MKTPLNIQTLKLISLFNKREMLTTLDLKTPSKIRQYSEMLFNIKNNIQLILNQQLCNSRLNSESFLSIAKNEFNKFFFVINFKNLLPFTTQTCNIIRTYFTLNHFLIKGITFNQRLLTIDNVIFYIEQSTIQNSFDFRRTRD